MIRKGSIKMASSSLIGLASHLHTSIVGVYDCYPKTNDLNACIEFKTASEARLFCMYLQRYDIELFEQRLNEVYVNKDEFEDKICII